MPLSSCVRAVRVEAEERTERVALLVVHVAGDEAALAVDLAVVHADARLTGIGIDELAAGAGREVQRVEAVAQRDDAPPF